MVASLAKILSAVIIIATGLYYLVVLGKTDNLARSFANSTLAPDRLANAFFAGLFSYDGWDVLNFGVEDVRDPRKSMTFAIAVGISTVAVLYLLMNAAYFIVLSIAQIEKSAAVATTFAQHSLGDFQYAIPFLVSVLLIGSLNSQLFAASR
jgi:amino acid transporter